MFILCLIGLAVLCLMLWIGYKLTGALLVACFWLFIEVPVTLFLWALALVCFCTLLLIPVGIWLVKLGLRIVVPGV
ncbi:MAG: hypothetical protein IJA58_06455 [Lachnospiraceae bacterium]|nr:hypothetical protein [Lachnospiraceae bacterium]